MVCHARPVRDPSAPPDASPVPQDATPATQNEVWMTPSERWCICERWCVKDVCDKDGVREMMCDKRGV